MRALALLPDPSSPLEFETAEQALLGGADCIQLREKDLESGELLRRAELLVQLCHRHGALCVINDRPDIALLARADGVTAPDPAVVRDVTARVAALLADADMRGADQGAGCAACLRGRRLDRASCGAAA